MINYSEEIDNINVIKDRLIEDCKFRQEFNRPTMETKYAIAKLDESIVWLELLLKIQGGHSEI